MCNILKIQSIYTLYTLSVTITNLKSKQVFSNYFIVFFKNVNCEVKDRQEGGGRRRKMERNFDQVP